MSVKWGKSFDTWKESKALLEKVGFVDVVEKRFKWPMNGWSDDPTLKRLGRLNQIRVTEHIQGFTLRLLTGAGEVSKYSRLRKTAQADRLSSGHYHELTFSWPR